MTYNINELNQLKELWQAAEVEAVELQSPVSDGPQFPLGAVPIPISSTARQNARRMAELCRDAECRETMQRNLLATIAVHDYLNLQGYLPDLGASDSWNPILGRTGEVADLVVSQVGRFECCAIKPGQSSCPVPSEGQFGRSGYVAVEMDAEERWGWLLGFIPSGDESAPIEILNRRELQSMDEFGHHLYRLWLLWTIVQQESEPWDVEVRGEMVALLERIYRTRSAAQRPMRAAAEIAKLWGEEVAEQIDFLDLLPPEASFCGPVELDEDFGDIGLPSSVGSYGSPPANLNEKVVGAEPRELTGAISREGDSSAQPELRQFLRGVFDRLEDALVMEEEGDNGR
jgi:Protein of unknown function (DUF1822)